MHETRWSDVERVLDAVLDHDTAEWAAAVEEACGGDPELRRAVETLLQRAADLDGYLEAPAARVTALLHQLQDAPDPSGTALGPWRIEEEVGRGGMGVVYRGARADGLYDQAVAVKLLRADAAEAARRFALERQVLADLDHPGIARLLDGGVTDDGRPFLVMAFVEGEPLDAYCERRGLGVADRLRLFLQVCDAVAYAHRHLVVHRDLKPSNVLVAEEAGRPQVKLLDFGIAKLLDAPEGDGAPVLTQAAQRPFTPAYAAPEQVEGRAVTTATDVWGLGVVLFELLAGRLPFRYDPTAPRAIERAILEEPAPRPSAVAPEALRRRLAGDLDAVVAKALRKAPGDRYATADALAADLRLHLDGLPVEARRGAAGYRLRKFVGRHRLGVGIGTAVFVLAVVAAVAFAVQAARLEQALTAAEAQGQRAEEVSGVLTGMFEESNLYTGGDPDIPARELLARGLARADALADQPDAQASVLLTIGTAYNNLSLYAEARPPLDRALALLERRYGPRHLAVADAQRARADLAINEGSDDLADSLHSAALATYRALLPPGDVRLIQALNGLAMVRTGRVRWAEAEPLVQEAIRLGRAMPEPPPELAMSLNLHAQIHRNLGRLDEAVPLMEASVALNRRLLGPDNLLTLTALSNLATMQREQGDTEGLEATYRAIVDGQRRAAGDDHLALIRRVNDLAVFLRDQGRYDEAAPLFRENIARGRRLPEPHADGLGVTLSSYGKLLLETGALDEAERVFTEAREVFLQTLGPDHSRNARALAGLGNVWLARGEPVRAERYFRDALAVRSALPPEHRGRVSVETDLAASLTAQGRYAEAEALLLHALPALEAIHHAEVPLTRERLVALYEAWGRSEDAERYR